MAASWRSWPSMTSAICPPWRICSSTTSNYGRFGGQVEVKGDSLMVDGKTIKAFKETDPAAIPWGSLGVDIVIEFDGLVHSQGRRGEQEGQDRQGSGQPHHERRGEESHHLRPRPGRRHHNRLRGERGKIRSQEFTTSSRTPRARPMAWGRRSRSLTTISRSCAAS